MYSKTCIKKGHSQKDQKLVFKTNYSLMQVKSIAEHSAILSTFIKLPFGIKIFVLSIFEWPFYTGFTVRFSHSLIMHVHLSSRARDYNVDPFIYVPK